MKWHCIPLAMPQKKTFDIMELGSVRGEGIGASKQCAGTVFGFRKIHNSRTKRAEPVKSLEGSRLSASEFLDRVAALIPPPRKHRQRYFGVLAPNSPWRAQVTAQAGRKLVAGSKAPRPKTVRTDCGTPRAGHPARYLWAQLLARIYGVAPLKCSGCGGRVCLVGVIT